MRLRQLARRPSAADVQREAPRRCRPSSRCRPDRGRESSFLLPPQVLVRAETEKFVDIPKIVGHVHDEAFVLAAIRGTTQPSTCHLDVGARAEGRASDVQRAYTGRIEALDEQIAVREDAQLAGLDPFDDVSTLLAARLTTDGGCLDVAVSQGRR